MTHQVSEVLYIGRERHALYVRPLDQFLKSLELRMKFVAWSTSCHRGYIGHWELKNERLYLRKLEGLLEQRQTCMLAVVFRTEPRPVFAKWYSGTLRVPFGAIVVQNHLGYTHVHEDEIRIRVRRGVVRKTFRLRSSIRGRLVHALKTWVAKQLAH